jgi:hypothetical protein
VATPCGPTQVPTLLRDMGGDGSQARRVHDSLAGSGLQSSHSVRMVVNALLQADPGGPAAVDSAAQVLLMTDDAQLLHAGTFQVRWLVTAAFHAGGCIYVNKGAGAGLTESSVISLSCVLSLSS